MPPGSDETGLGFVGREASTPGPDPRAVRPPCVFVLSRQAARTLDRLAVERYGLPTIVLMENAAVALSREALSLLAERGRDDCVILAGPGNNGGDGLALARHLDNAGARVRVLLAADPGRLRGETASQLRTAVAMGLAVEPFTAAAGESHLGAPPGLVVDAILGTGLDRAPRGLTADAIVLAERLRRRGSLVLAADLPSGLDADTGEPLGDLCVTADVTVTFAALKPGLLTLSAQDRVGEIVVADIGVPRALLAELGSPVDHTPRLSSEDEGPGGWENGTDSPPKAAGRD